MPSGNACGQRCVRSSRATSSFVTTSAVEPLAEVREIGPAAVFLASDEASYVSGLVMTVDGAFTAAM